MRRELLKNKLYGILLILAGLITVPLLSGDGTFALCACGLGGYLLVARKDYVDGEEEWLCGKRRKKFLVKRYK